MPDPPRQQPPDSQRVLPEQRVQLLVLASNERPVIASIWALEAFAMTAGVLAAVAGFRAYLLPAGSRLRWLARMAALAVAACAAAHIIFALATLVRSGELPDWGQYLAYLDAFLLGDLAT